MHTANEIRRVFLDYFRKEGHEIVPSSPLVPRNDPTLMFVNSGMVQFKNVFTGQEKRPYVRASTAQKCVRAGGKHNDLENVGYTARHHTFFEMLGNFSFGDYFKERAIPLAWNLITKEFGLSPDKLTVTVFSEDDEAFAIWKKLTGFPDSRIVRISTSDNFWAMGDTGPCGPCSEIFYDHGPSIPGGPPGSPDADGDRFVEIWNLVFMQFEQVTKSERVDLPRPSIDTGMGLERRAAVLQGKHDNYDIDLMRSLIEASAQASNTDPDGPGKVSHRVIADHLRSSAFLIADGVLPSNEGRGYVLRRIMRRAMRHAHMLGCQEPLMWRLVPALAAEMGQAYPELIRAQAAITETLKLEETRFKQTLDRGLKLLDEETGKLGSGQKLPGEVAFKLYDTFGFPLDLTADILRGQKRELDQAGFDAAMERQRETARKAWAGSGEAATETVWFNLKQKLGATEFLGYATEHAQGVVLALLKDGKEVESAKAGDEIALVANQTPFYGESGGQMGDSGRITTAEGGVIEISDTLKKLGELHVHIGKVAKGDVKRGDTVDLRVDGARRNGLRAHHSATHLLHEALRRRLGEHVTQKGSLVAPDRLRFDFSHNKALTPEDIAWIEHEVNRRIRANADVETQLMAQEAAIAAGAMALFGEKYGDEVRVVTMGGRTGIDGEDEPKDFSTELCGGTHVRRTGDIGFLKIVSESAVGAGLRRIEAVTGAAAERYIDQQQKLLNDAAHALKAVPEDLSARIVSLVEERKRLERELAEMRRQLATGGGAGNETRSVNGVKLAARLLPDVPAKELKSMADDLKKQLGSGVVALIATAEGKASVVVGVTADLTAKISAVDLVKAGSAALGGQGGGGRPDMAQAGGPNAANANEAIAAIEAAIRDRIKAA
jgi:alanyl-tRNA synthetase